MHVHTKNYENWLKVAFSFFVGVLLVGLIWMVADCLPFFHPKLLIVFVGSSGVYFSVGLYLAKESSG